MEVEDWDIFPTAFTSHFPSNVGCQTGRAVNAICKGRLRGSEMGDGTENLRSLYCDCGCQIFLQSSDLERCGRSKP